MLRKLSLLAACCMLLFATSRAVTPKLVIVISIDQFRYDYLVRFRPYFGDKGFNYFLEHGANFVNARFKHAINTTGPGHAAIASGTYGNANGIIANDWYDRASGKWVYCVEDRTVSLVGSKGDGRSPRNFIGSTLGDEIRLKYGFSSKVVSVSNKDRAAILLGGKMPNAAFWMQDSVFVSSTYYMSDLPEWVRRFNRSGLIASYFKKVWTKTLPPSAYEGLDDDDVPYEADDDGSGRTFPHRIVGRDSSKITPSYYWSLARSPFSAEILSAFAKQAIEAEQLGQRGITDMLCVSFSGMDIVGHAYGPHSHEVMDMVVRMDRVLADFLSFLNTKLGLDNCLLVLTSDHGVMPIAGYLKRYYPTMDAGRISVDSLWKFCFGLLERRFGLPKDDARWIDAIVGNNIYLRAQTLQQPNIPPRERVAGELADSLRRFFPIAAAYTSTQLLTMQPTTPIEAKMKRSFHPLRSGDVMYALKPYWTEGDSPSGTSHGEPYEYDAHVPLIVVGEGIRKGRYAMEVSPVDLAPTLSVLLGVEFPAGREGRVLVEALR